MIRPRIAAPLIAALSVAAALAAAQPALCQGYGEELPPGAPTDSYELAAWCYGALSEYLAIYEKVVPDLKDIDKMFGTSVKEAKPYSADMAAARVELKMIADAVTDAEKASPQPLTDQGLASMNEGRAIWSVAEHKTQRELARAWLLWAMPDQCDANAKELTRRSLLLGTALKGNEGAPLAAEAGRAPKPVEPAPDAIDAFLAQQAQAAGQASSTPPPAADTGAQSPPVQTPPADTPPAQSPPDTGQPPPATKTDTPPS